MAKNNMKLNTSKNSKLMTHGVMVMGIILNLVYFNYVFNLEKKNCKCSEDWRRTFIKYYSLALIFQFVLMLFLKKNKIIKPLLQLLIFVTSLLGIVEFYALISFSRDLKLKKCECSKGIDREFIYWYTVIILFTLLSLIGMGVIGGVFKGSVVAAKSV